MMGTTLALIASMAIAQPVQSGRDFTRDLVFNPERDAVIIEAVSGTAASSTTLDSTVYEFTANNGEIRGNLFSIGRVSPQGKVLWEVKLTNAYTESDSMFHRWASMTWFVPVCSNYFVVRSKTLSAGNHQYLSCILCDCGSGKPIWQWRLWERTNYERSDLESPQRATLENDGCLRLFQPDFFRVKRSAEVADRDFWSMRAEAGEAYLPGYVAGLGDAVELNAATLEAHLVVVGLEKFRADHNGKQIRPNQFATAPDQYFNIDRDIEDVTNAVSALGEYISQFEECVPVDRRLSPSEAQLPDRDPMTGRVHGLGKLLTPAEVRAHRAAPLYQEVLDQQITKEEALKLLKQKYELGVQLFAKAFNKAISGPLLMKSPTVAKEFSPNTASLVRKAIEAEILTPIQKRRVNAQYLLDMMKSDVGSVVIRSPRTDALVE